MKKYYLTILIALTFSTLSFGQDKWLIKNPNSFDYYLTTHIKNEKIVGKTRNNAYIDLAGRFKFFLVKITTPVKHPEIVHFEGEMNENKFKGDLQMIFNQVAFDGEIKNDSILLTIHQQNGSKSKISGIKVDEIKPIRNYKKTFNKIFELTEDFIYNQSFLQSKQWRKFKKRMMKLSNKINDDFELQIAVAALARDFPFSHYYVYKTRNENSKKAKSNFASLKDVNKSTCILKINEFQGSKNEMDSLISIIENKKHENLIIDLRDNPGGHLEAAFPLAEYIIDKPIVAGVFPNKNWYAKYNRIPNKTDYSLFTEFTGGTINEWYKKSAENYGAYYKVIPSKRHFNGEVYILTNNNTASTCEPFVFGLKHHNYATIIGEQTAGAMLSAKDFEVDDGISIIIPLNDYITYSGKRIDKTGIQPDIEIESSKAQKYILDVLKEADKP